MIKNAAVESDGLTVNPAQTDERRGTIRPGIISQPFSLPSAGQSDPYLIGTFMGEEPKAPAKPTAAEQLGQKTPSQIDGMTRDALIAMNPGWSDFGQLDQNRQNALYRALIYRLLDKATPQTIENLPPQLVSLIWFKPFNRDGFKPEILNAVGKAQAKALKSLSAGDIEKMDKNPELMQNLDMKTIQELSPDKQEALKKSMKKSIQQVSAGEIGKLPIDVVQWLDLQPDELKGFSVPGGQRAAIDKAMRAGNKMGKDIEGPTFLGDPAKAKEVLSLLNQYLAQNRLDSPRDNLTFNNGTVEREGYVPGLPVFNFKDKNGNPLLDKAVVLEPKGNRKEPILIVGGKTYGMDGKPLTIEKPDSDVTNGISYSKSLMKDESAKLVKDLRKGFPGMSGRKIADIQHLLEGQDLSGIDFRYADFSGVDLSRLNLQGAKLKDASFKGAQFKGANLKGVDFEGAYLGGAQFNGAKFEGASLAGAHFNSFPERKNPNDYNEPLTTVGSDLTGADLRGAILAKRSYVVSNAGTWTKTEFDGAKLGGANLDGISFENTYLKGADLNGVDFKNIKLQGADLVGANFNGAKLGGSNLKGVHFGGAKLGGANLDGADFNGAIMNWSHNRYAIATNFEGADFKGAKLAGADWAMTNFKKAKLAGADLNGADLSNAVFEDIDLNGVDFKGAKLKGASMRIDSLKGAKLQGADLNGLELYRSSLKGVDLNGVDFKGVTLTNKVAEDADFTGAKLEGAKYNSASFKGAKLAGINLSIFGPGADLSQADISGAIFDGENLDFSTGSLSGIPLNTLKFDKLKLIKANFSDRKQNKLTFNETDLTGANMTGSEFKQATFTKAKLNGLNTNRGPNAPAPATNFEEVQMNGVEARDADFRKASFARAMGVTNTDFTGSDFSDANLSQGSFSDSKFIKAKFSKDSNLSQASFFKSDLSQAVFDGSNLSEVNMTTTTVNGTQFKGANFTKANLTELKGDKNTSFEGANLTKAKLIQAELDGSNFSGANLTDADLSNSKLTGANLKGAKLNGAFLVGTDLSGAQFDDGKTGDASQLKGTYFDDTTKLPGIDNNNPAARQAFAQKYGMIHVGVFRKQYSEAAQMPDLPKQNDFAISGTDIRMSDLPALINANRGETNILGLWQADGITQDHLKEALKRVENPAYLRQILKDKGADPKIIDEIIADIGKQSGTLKRVLREMHDKFSAFDTNGDGKFSKADLKEMGKRNTDNIYNSMKTLSKADWQAIRDSGEDGKLLESFFNNPLTPARAIKEFIPGKFEEMSKGMLEQFLGIRN